MEHQDFAPDIVLRVENICCSAYAKKLKKELSKLNEVYSVDIDPEKSLVSIRGRVDPNSILNTVARTGKQAKIVCFNKKSPHSNRWNSNQSSSQHHRRHSCTQNRNNVEEEEQNKREDYVKSSHSERWNSNQSSSQHHHAGHSCSQNRNKGKEEEEEQHKCEDYMKSSHSNRWNSNQSSSQHHHRYSCCQNRNKGKEEEEEEEEHRSEDHAHPFIDERECRDYCCRTHKMRSTRDHSVPPRESSFFFGRFPHRAGGPACCGPQAWFGPQGSAEEPPAWFGPQSSTEEPLLRPPTGYGFRGERHWPGFDDHCYSGYENGRGCIIT